MAAFAGGAGFVFAFVGGLIFGGVLGAGTGAGDFTGGVSGGATTPAARSPAGAAINWTRYSGGAGADALGAAKNTSRATTPPCKSTEANNPPVRRGGLAAAITLSNLLGLRHESHVGNPRLVENGQELHDQPIVDALVCSEIHAVLRSVHCERPHGRPELTQR